MPAGPSETRAPRCDRSLGALASLFAPASWPDGYLSTDTHRFEAGTRALATEIARTSDVSDYLQGVSHSTLTDVHASPFDLDEIGWSAIGSGSFVLIAGVACWSWASAAQATRSVGSSLSPTWLW